MGTDGRARDHESEQLPDAIYRRVFEEAGEGVLIANAKGHYVAVNAKACELTGYTRDELLRMQIPELLVPEELALHRLQLEEIRQKQVMVFERTLTRKDGSRLSAEIAGCVLGSGHLLGFVRDIGQRKRDEAALHHVTRLYAVLGEVNQAVVRVRDRNRLFAAIAQIAVEAGGLRMAWIGVLDRDTESVVPLVHAGHEAGYLQHLDITTAASPRALGPTASAMRNGHIQICSDIANDPHFEPWREEALRRGYRASAAVPLRLRGEVMGCLNLYADEPGFFTLEEQELLERVGADISFALDAMATEQDRAGAEEERARLLSRLTDAQRLEAVGRLAGGIAHDFNNTLAVILGYAQQALSRDDVSEALRADLTQIESAAQRSADVARQILAFARKQAITPRVVDLNQTLRETRELLEKLVGPHVRVFLELAPDLARVSIDPAQVDQVVSNLAVNARDAILGAGSLVLRTRNVYMSDSDFPPEVACPPGNYVHLTATDSGSGMDEKTLAHIFEPFFSTKGPGRGTGLGLATVYGIVQQNGGFMCAESEPGRGSTFSVYLPRCEGEPYLETLTLAHAQPSGEGSVLLVEDDPSLMVLFQLQLEQLGYRVFVAHTPTDALAMFAERASEIDVMLTDVLMPGMNGRELAEALQRVSPSLRCVFMSGYADDLVSQDLRSELPPVFLQKPFSQRELGKALAKALSPATQTPTSAT